MTTAAQQRYLRIRMATETGWSLADIDGMTWVDWCDYWAVADAQQAITTWAHHQIS